MSETHGKPTDDRVLVVMERLFTKIDNREKLHEIHLDLVSMRGEQRTANAAIEGVSKTVYGNGTPGLKTEVDRLVQDFADRRWRDRALWAVLLTTLSGVVVLLFRVYVIGG